MLDRGKGATPALVREDPSSTEGRDVKRAKVRARTAEIAARNRAFRSRYQRSRAYFRG